MSSEVKKRQRKTFNFRLLLRSLHRDVGYLLVGLTFVYAVSGLAVNHIADWDPNFTAIEAHKEVPAEMHLQFSPSTPEQNRQAAQQVLALLKLKEEPTDIYAIDDKHLDITLENGDVRIDLEAHTIDYTGQEARFFVRAANYLHLNRGKKAWTVVADSYAVLLLFLATSGLFMIRGRKGLFGRGAVIALIGAGIPVAYVLLSGP